MKNCFIYTVERGKCCLETTNWFGWGKCSFQFKYFWDHKIKPDSGNSGELLFLDFYFYSTITTFNVYLMKVLLTKSEIFWWYVLTYHFALLRICRRDLNPSIVMFLLLRRHQTILHWKIIIGMVMNYPAMILFFTSAKMVKELQIHPFVKYNEKQISYGSS